MRFVVSLTVNASQIRRVSHLWAESGDPRNPFQDVLVSPLFAAPSTLRAIRALKEQWGSRVYFDSGGFYVQQGRIAYLELCHRLADYYHQPENQWADFYVLPDYVPTSSDSVEDIETKVRETYTQSQQFFHDLPVRLQPHALPVIQGHTAGQVRRCVEVYHALGVPQVGFGSFGTSGASASINRMTSKAHQMLRYVRELASQHHLDVHLFGVGTPPILYLFHSMGFSSFDSMSWMRAAGFGNVFLPFMRGFLVSQRAASMFRSSLDRDTFERFKLMTEHECPFCEDFIGLTENRYYRILHNLASILDTIHLIQQWTRNRILQVIESLSPSYLRYYQEFLPA